jgi:hypothetical protein
LSDEALDDIFNLEYHTAHVELIFNKVFKEEEERV